VLIGAALSGAIACSALQPDHTDIARGVVPLTPTSTLVADLIPIGDAATTGVIRFYHDPEGVRVVGHVTGLVPNQKHGFHIHVFGDTTDRAEAASAGVHFNPFNRDHALPPASHRHAGSFPNLEADDQGVARIDFIDETITLTEGLTAILARSVIVHEREDIGEQPWGGAGGRIAAGVIGLANPESTPPLPHR
jgi:Cu-Zn family superoxide dismutase